MSASSSRGAVYDDNDDPEAPTPTEATPLTGEGAFALAAATSPSHYAHGSGQGEPPERQISQSDADADRIGEELLGVSGGEEAVHEWIKKSLNLLPPLRESRVYDEYYDEQQPQQQLGSAPSHGSADLLPTVTEGQHGQQLTTEGGELRRSRSASVGRQYQSLRPPQNYSGVGVPPPPAGYSSVRFADESGGVRRVQTYGGTSVRFGGGQQRLSSGHLRASGMGTDKVHLTPRRDSGAGGGAYRMPPASGQGGFYGDWGAKGRGNVLMKVACMAAIASAVLVGLLAGLFYMGEKLVGPPRQPVGAYKIIELQEGDAFWNYYNFYVGPDSIGSNGYLNYIGKDKAFEIGIANVSVEAVQETATRRRAQEATPMANATSTPAPGETETFVYMSSAPTEKGPRDSIRLEGKRRFNRGLFIIDLHHMPAGCGVWPAFWLTDEANWPVNGEIDIVEGVNYQSVAKTALHSTQVCKMDDVPLGTKTGGWDTAVGSELLSPSKLFSHHIIFIIQSNLTSFRFCGIFVCHSSSRQKDRSTRHDHARCNELLRVRSSSVVEPRLCSS